MGDRFKFSSIGEASQNLEDDREFEHVFKIERLKKPELANKYKITLVSGESRVLDANCVADIFDTIPKDQVVKIQSLTSLDNSVFHDLESCVAEKKAADTVANNATTPADQN